MKEGKETEGTGKYGGSRQQEDDVTEFQGSDGAQNTLLSFPVIKRVNYPDPPHSSPRNFYPNSLFYYHEIITSSPWRVEMEGRGKEGGGR